MVKRAVLLGLIALSGACGGVREDPFTEPEEPLSGSAFVYRCTAEASFVVRFVGDSARVTRDLYHAALPRAVSASGARYAQDAVVFWDKGGVARFETPGGTFEGCDGERAGTPWELSWLLGYEFRGVGQEPGWLVEIDEGRRMHVLADYGEVEFFTSPPNQRAMAGGATVYRAESGRGEVVVTVREEPCDDVMSGERFPRKVTLAFAGRVLHGCGAPLPLASAEEPGDRP